MKIPSLRTVPSPSAFRLAIVAVFAALYCAHAADPAPAVAASTTAPAGPIRIVDCGTHVQSKKRGVCENKMFPEDFAALAPGVSWYYNWHYTTDDFPPKGVNMQYLPQVWGHDDEVAGLATYLATHPKPPVVLAINEPNLRGQAFISPQATAELYKKVMAVSGSYNIPVVGPNMSLGSASGDSITAMDPIDNKQVTYTFMIPFLKAFNYYMGSTPVTASVLHTYGNIGELKWATGEMHKQFNKPVWITEFAEWHAGSPAESVNYLIQAVDFFESAPYVAGYAFFKERASNNSSNISLLTQNHGELSALGKAYVNLPVHDADLYYRIPGRLQAGSYVNALNSDIELTDDKENTGGPGMFDMDSTGPAQLYYNIQVDKAGSYTLKFRVSDHGNPIEISHGTVVAGAPAPGQETVLGATPPTANGWQTVEATVPLPAGPQTLHIRTGGQTVEWIEFASPAPAADSPTKN